MDPPALMSDSAYSLSEIWPFAIGSGAGRPQFGQGQFGDFASASNQSDPMSVDVRERKRRDGDDDSAKGVSSSSNNGASDSNGKRIKCKDDNGEVNGEAEAGPGKPGEQSSRVADPAKQDYIHVRARRGQATDSHSLAERARREKISERMKILQDLVPGCNKVIGKALVLDEIINYIQSLQRQVEFLSMKLEAVNSRMTPGIEVFPSKDMNLATQFGQQAFEAGMGFSQPPRDFSRGSSSDWLHMQVGGGFERAT